MNKSKLEALREKRMDLERKNAQYAKELEDKLAGTRVSSVPAAEDPFSGNQTIKSRYPITESDPINIFTQKQEEKKVMLNEGVLASYELETLRLQQTGEEGDTSETSSDNNTREEDEIERDLMNAGLTSDKDCNNKIRYADDSEVDELFEDQKERFLELIENTEEIIEADDKNIKNECFIKNPRPFLHPLP